MKMDSLSKSSSTTTSSNRSSGAGSKDVSSSSSSRLRESAHFENIMVEFEKDDREMAVDVPDSFVAHTKTPPKYPPPARMNGGGGGSGRSLNHNDVDTPPPPSRDHLRIERDGNLLNTREGPTPPSRDHHHQGSGFVVPTEQQSQRMKKYSDELVKRAREAERRDKSEDFLRLSIRNSQRLNALKENSSNNISGLANGAFVGDAVEAMTKLPDPNEVLKSVKRLQQSGVLSGDISASIRTLVTSSEFQGALTLNQKLHKVHPRTCAPPLAREAQETAEECVAFLDGLCELHQGEEDAIDAGELASILCKETMEGLLCTHDKLAARHDVFGRGGSGKRQAQPEDALLDRLSRYSEPNIRVVRIEKTQEPLGATVKNEDDAVVVGRIIRGGTAEASGLLQEGDELLEVNEVPLRGKNVNEVCDLLADMKGTLTLLVVPARQQQQQSAQQPKQAVMHVKAHIDYDPEDDPYVPCRELGISFFKGDILHVLNQRDPHWWQARREGEDDSQLPGLIPSASFQQQREAVKHTIAHDVDSGGGKNKSNSSGFLCAKRSGRRNKKRRGKAPYGNAPGTDDDEMMETGTADEVIAYEEVALYYPRSARKRPVVLIGPPNIGRHELRQRLMQDGERFAAAIPHTSRPKRADEVDGQDYHFISRLQFEQDILARKFVEHGEYEKSYYGTSLEAIRSVVLSEKICVLNLHPQSLRVLKNSDLMPFVVFVAPPSLEKLRRWKLERSSEPVDDDELKEIIERARQMEEAYGHYFDMVIVYADPERAYQELLREINLLEREPQWVPASWLARNSF